MDEPTRAASGRALEELTLEAVLEGGLDADDLRISDETLRQQADRAEAAGYRRFAENLRRAAELTHVSNEEVLEIYDALRPGRATYSELIELADRLENTLDAPLNAAFVRDAAEVYLQRGIVKARPGR